jgi:hypothetical protein
VLLVGSASLKRKKPKDDAGTEALAEVVPASGPGNYFADYAYALDARIGERGWPEFKLVSATDLRAILLGLPLLASFREIPSKDNGIDLEGAVVHGGFFYFGLRGPVLRGRALVARMRSDFSDPVLFSLDLGGLGVRALSYVEGNERTRGIYILAGPTMLTKTEFALYRWVGFDSASERDAVQPVLVSVAPSHAGLQPEALFPLGSALCALSDGAPGGSPMCREFR